MTCAKRQIYLLATMPNAQQLFPLNAEPAWRKGWRGAEK